MLGLPVYKSAPIWPEKAKMPTTKQTRKGCPSVRYLGVFHHFTLDSVHLSINHCARSVKICHDKWIMPVYSKGMFNPSHDANSVTCLIASYRFYPLLLLFLLNAAEPRQ